MEKCILDRRFVACPSAGADIKEVMKEKSIPNYTTLCKNMAEIILVLKLLKLVIPLKN